MAALSLLAAGCGLGATGDEPTALTAPTQLATARPTAEPTAVPTDTPFVLVFSTPTPAPTEYPDTLTSEGLADAYRLAIGDQPIAKMTRLAIQTVASQSEHVTVTSYGVEGGWYAHVDIDNRAIVLNRTQRNQDAADHLIDGMDFYVSEDGEFYLPRDYAAALGFADASGSTSTVKVSALALSGPEAAVFSIVVPFHSFVSFERMTMDPVPLSELRDTTAVYERTEGDGTISFTLGADLRLVGAATVNNDGTVVFGVEGVAEVPSPIDWDETAEDVTERFRSYAATFIVNNGGQIFD